jgi:myo-inositol-1(or 4)-monophosphatase
MSTFLEVCEHAARAAGQVLLDWQHRFTVREKGPADLVTEADVAAQEAVQRIVLQAFPKHGFVAEENVAIPSQESGYRWIVDPLDGTTNYVHRMPEYAVSIALEQHGRVLAGCVFNPANGECYTAARGEGARLNGRAIQCSGIKELSRAMVGASFPASITRDSIDIARFADMLVTAQSLRRLGSAALNLSFVAAGRLDGYWATSIKPWDIAAGILLVTEAGGWISDVSRQPLDLDRPRVLAAATPELAESIAAVLQVPPAA